MTENNEADGPNFGYNAKLFDDLDDMIPAE